ncbi:MAG: HlyC/CorC family transporter [Hyphomicrobiales bacterium]|nr:HlyC/CorC family transporter [Hyphomicrobiales bacterium]
MKLFAIVALVAGNAFFVGSEIALTSARRSRIKQLADMGNKSAKIVQVLHEEPERFYSVTQIGITLVSLALGAIGMITISHVLDPVFEFMFVSFEGGKLGESLVNTAHTVSYAIAFLIISFLHVVAGELAPKVLAFHKAEALSLAVARLINNLYKAFSWIIWFMNKSSDGLLWLFGQRDLSSHVEGHFSMSEEEIRTILSASEREGVLNADETKMIRGVFDLDEHTVREAMTPRTDVLAVQASDTVADALALFQERHHARYPVCEGHLDRVVGMIAMKELLNTVAQSKDNEAMLAGSVRDIMLPPYLVPESKTLAKLLKDFRNNRQQMAIVIDEFGGTAGLITLEDVLEEIVGDYDDEFTHRQHTGPAHRHVRRMEDGSFLITASSRVSELESAIDFPFPEEPNYFTIAGLVYKRLGRVPAVGDTVQLDAGRLEVAAMDNHRITQVRFVQLKAEPADEIKVAAD